MRYLTINTDASYNDRTGAAGFAYRIECDVAGQLRPTRLQGSGPGRATDVNESELLAMLQAVRRVGHARLWRKVNRVVLNSDSTKAIEILSGESNGPREPNWNPAITKAAQRVLAIIDGWQLPVEFKHVRAHTGKTDKRSSINNWCDRESRARRREEDKRIARARVPSLRATVGDKV